MSVDSGKAVTFDEWCKQNPDSGRYAAWVESAARYAPLVEAVEEWLHGDGPVTMAKMKKLEKALKAVTDE